MNRSNGKGYNKEADNNCFFCKVCGRLIKPHITGSEHRNHCPNCLSSLHLDNKKGDRSANCGGIMEPIGVWVKKMVNGL